MSCQKWFYKVGRFQAVSRFHVASSLWLDESAHSADTTRKSGHYPISRLVKRLAPLLGFIKAPLARFSIGRGSPVRSNPKLDLCSASQAKSANNRRRPSSFKDCGGSSTSGMD